jgi:hypothetical protein
LIAEHRRPGWPDTSTHPGVCHEPKAPPPPRRRRRRDHPRGGSGAQQWTVAAGALRNPQSGRCLDIPASNPANGQQLQIYDCNGTAAQNWTLP